MEVARVERQLRQQSLALTPPGCSAWFRAHQPWCPPCPERVLRAPWWPKRPGASLQPGGGLAVPDASGGRANGSWRRQGAPAGGEQVGWERLAVGETWQGWDDTQCGARQTWERLLRVTCLGRISKRRNWRACVRTREESLGTVSEDGYDSFRAGNRRQRSQDPRLLKETRVFRVWEKGLRCCSEIL